VLEEFDPTVIVASSVALLKEVQPSGYAVPLAPGVVLKFWL